MTLTYSAMTSEQARVIILNFGRTIKGEKRNNNNTGLELKLNNGAIVNVFDTGKVSLQGKPDEDLKRLLMSGDREVDMAIAPNRRIFVVYGHDANARTQLEAMLLRWQLEPVILDQLASAGQTIIEKLETASENIGYGVVLATPDDEGHRAGHEDEKKCRARQNVVLELGMLLAKLGRDRVAILLKQGTEMERPSDIQGLIYIPFTDNVNDAALLLNSQCFATSMGAASRRCLHRKCRVSAESRWRIELQQDDGQAFPSDQPVRTSCRWREPLPARLRASCARRMRFVASYARAR